eukprot:GHVP01068184.1.p1 GENE.GHVP01068184.1~~GHVP01068184.1.p1  ORF type:complete len:161 (+),score=51.14 GHVP01068184.1:1594-2076(+)
MEPNNFTIEELKELKKGILSLHEDDMQENKYTEVKKELSDIFEELADCTVHSDEEDKSYIENVKRAINNTAQDNKKLMLEVAKERRECIDNILNEYETRINDVVYKKKTIPEAEFDICSQDDKLYVPEPSMASSIEEKIVSVSEKLQRANKIITEDLLTK